MFAIKKYENFPVILWKNQENFSSPSPKSTEKTINPKILRPSSLQEIQNGQQNSQRNFIKLIFIFYGYYATQKNIKHEHISERNCNKKGKFSIECL
jgi:hypothetical protein